MKNLLQKFSLLLLACFFSLQSHAQYTEADLFNDLQNLLDNKRAAYNLPGAAVSITLRNGSTWTGVSGNKCSGSVIDSLQWQWGSVSKAMTATIIMQMRDQGLLDLNDSLGTYFDPSPYTSFIDASNNTIRDLLLHTSDIFDPWSPGSPGSPYYQFVTNNPCSVLTQASGLSYVNTTAPNPNKVHMYKPYINYALLSLVIESISGNSLKQEYQNRIYTPLGMNNSALIDSTYDLNNFNGLFANGNPRCNQCHTAYLTRAGGGAIANSIGDMTKFMNRLHGDSMLSSATMNEMRTTIDANISAPLPCGGNVFVEYGLGVLNPNLVFSPGDTLKLYGHSGSGRSTGSVFHSVDSGWTAAIVSNDYGTNGAPNPNQLTNAMIFDVLCFLHNNPVDFPTVIAPVADFGFNGNGTISFLDSSLNDPTSWHWDFGDGSIDTVQNPIHTYQSSGTYNVTLIASNSAGSDTISKPVSIIVGIEDLSLEDISIYPNPFNTTLNFDISGFQENALEIVIYNIHGLEIERMKSDGSESVLVWDAQEEKSGLYFYNIHVKGNNYKGKIVKE